MSALEWQILTEEDSAKYAALREQQEAEEAEHVRLVEACKRSGGHEWVLELPEAAEVDDSVQLGCTRCPAGVDDVYPDGFDQIYLDYGDVEVRGGMHNSTEPLTIPVTVDVVDTSMWTDYGWEYDAELIVEPKESP